MRVRPFKVTTMRTRIVLLSLAGLAILVQLILEYRALSLLSVCTNTPASLEHAKIYCSVPWAFWLLTFVNLVLVFAAVRKLSSNALSMTALAGSLIVGAVVLFAVPVVFVETVR